MRGYSEPACGQLHRADEAGRLGDQDRAADGSDQRLAGLADQEPGDAGAPEAAQHDEIEASRPARRHRSCADSIWRRQLSCKATFCACAPPGCMAASPEEMTRTT